MFENEIAQYELLLEQYNGYISSRMSVEDLRQYNEVLFSAHSCAIEGTDEYLVSYFFKTAMARMTDEISQKKKQSGPRLFIF